MVAEIRVVRIGHPPVDIASCSTREDATEAVRIRHRKWSEDQRIQQAENRGVCPDAERERQDRDDGEAFLTQQIPVARSGCPGTKIDMIVSLQSGLIHC